MKDTVIVIGCDGYIGHALTLRLLEDGYKVVGIDDFQRRENVEEMGSFSAVEIEDPEVRHEKFKKIGEFYDKATINGNFLHQELKVFADLVFIAIDKQTLDRHTSPEHQILAEFSLDLN